MEEECEITEQSIRRSKWLFESDSVAELESKRRKVNQSRTAAESLSSENLIEVIKGSGKQIPQVVKLWVEQYEKDSKPAMVQLLTMLFETMLFEACGTEFSSIQEELSDKTNLDNVVVALVNMAAQGTIEDFQSSKKKEFRSLKENLVSFWDNLVSECQHGPLFDQVLFDKCMEYVIALSCTPTRVYRQVASLVGLQMVTSFIGVAKMLGTQRQTMQTLLTAEKKKKSDGPHIESLNKSLSETHAKITMIEEMMRKIYTWLFVDRYQGIDPDIRMSCIQSLGAWIASYPSLFLQDLYLKYIVRALNDHSAGVRKASVLALQDVYDVDDNVPSLGPFTWIVYKRLLELANDTDISVAQCAISFVQKLWRRELVPREDLRSLFALLIDYPPEIRRAIGELVHDHVIAQKFSSSHLRSSGDEGDQSQIHLLRMLQILSEFPTDQVLSLYVIDNIWEFMGAMKDWERITSMLLDENPSSQFTDDDATNLIRMFCASVKKAVGERIVPAINHRKPNHTDAQKEIIESSKKNITVCMIKNYPQLMLKYMFDKEKVPSLVEIIVYMDLELYSLESQDQNFKEVLYLMKETFFTHGDKDALRSCVRAIDYCSSGSPGELKDYAQNTLKEVEGELVVNVKSAIREVANGDDMYLLVNTKRLYELQLTRQVQIEDLYADIIAVLKNYRNIDDETVGFLLLNMYLNVKWCVRSIMKSSETVSEELLSSLITKRNELYEQLDNFLQILLEAQGKGTPRNLLACRVCTLLAEFWCLFQKSLYTSSRSKVKRLGCQPAKSTLENFWKLCEYQLDISEYVEETNRDAIMIAAAKLVSSGAGHEVKHLVSCIRKREADVSYIILEALKLAHGRYLAALSTSDDESLSTRRNKECQDLASRLSSFLEESSAVILEIVKTGIDYAFADAPVCLSFLTSAVLHFASKLPSADIYDILKNLEDRKRNIKTFEDPSAWYPYWIFVGTLC